MGPLVYLGLMLVAAFLLQGLFGFIQIKNFSENYRIMRQQGRVLIGKNLSAFNQEPYCYWRLIRTEILKKREL